MLRVGISACLLGERVRHDGGHKRDDLLLATLGPHVEWVPVCPEIELGLGAPRPALRLVARGRDVRLVAPSTGEDHTGAMRRYARDRVGALGGERLHGFVLKSRSPSCGLLRVKFYRPGAPRPLRRGRGLFAAELAGRFPLLPVEEERSLARPGRLANFAERLLARERWLRLLEEDDTPDGLMALHAEMARAIRSRDADSERALGLLAARARRGPWPRGRDRYGARLFEILARPAPRAHRDEALERLAATPPRARARGRKP